MGNTIKRCVGTDPVEFVTLVTGDTVWVSPSTPPDPDIELWFDTDENTDPPWIGLAYGSGWSTYDGTYMPGGYRKVGDEVQVRGLVKCSGVGTTIATLPVGYRPPYHHLYMNWGVWVGGTGGRGAVRLDLTTAGIITLNTSSDLPSGTTNGTPTSWSHVSIDTSFSVTA